MTAINHPIFKSNNDGDLKLESGEIDVSQQFTAQIWKMWEDKGKPVGTWLKKKPYYLPGNLPLLIFNLNKKGLDNVKVRQAIAYAIDYPNIAATAMSSYSDPANASLILPTGYEAKFYDQAAVKADGWSFNKDKAISDPRGRPEGQEGLRRHLRAARRHQARRLEVDHSDRLDRLEHGLRDRGRESPRRSASASTPSSRRRPMITRCRTATSTSACTATPGVSPASPWIPVPGRDGRPRRRRLWQEAYYNYNRFKHPQSPALLDTRPRRPPMPPKEGRLPGPRQDLPPVDPRRSADVPGRWSSTSTTRPTGKISRPRATRTHRRCGKVLVSSGCSN